MHDTAKGNGAMKGIGEKNNMRFLGQIEATEAKAKEETAMGNSDASPKGCNVHGPLLRLLVLSAILLVMWSFVVPIFEAPDESHHWIYARYVHDHRRLPPFSPEMVEATHPPLYYLLIAPLAVECAIPPMRVESSRFGSYRLMCPPRFYENCYSDFRRYWPIRFGRLVSVFLSLITVLFTYLAAREATGSEYTGILASSLTLLLPQFTFRGTNISCDVGVTTMCAVSTYFVVRLFRRGFTWRTAWLASLSCVLAFLSKVSAIIFIPVLAGALMAGAPNWRLRMKRLSVILIVPLLAAPWLIRNQLLSGDLLAIQGIAKDLPEIVTRRSLWSPYFLTTFPTVSAQSFVGVFGYMNVYLPRRLYWIFAALAVAAVAGLCRGLFRRKLSARLVGILVALPVMSVASLVQFNLTFTQPQGRYVFPALPAVMILAAIGLEALPGWNRRLTYAIVAIFTAVNLYALIGVEFLDYWLPQPRTITAVAGTSVSTDLMKRSAEPLITGGQFGQTFLAERDNLSGVELQIATYGKTIPGGFVKLHLRSGPEDTKDIASTVAPAIPDYSFVRLSFPPIPDSKERSYYVFIDTDGLPGGHKMTVFTSNTDVYPGGQFMLNGKPTSFDTDFRALYTTITPACPACLAR